MGAVAGRAQPASHKQILEVKAIQTARTVDNSPSRAPLAVIRVLYGMRRFLILCRFAILCRGGGTESRKRSNVDVSPVDVSPDMEHSVTARRGTYAGFHRGDMTAAEPLEERIEWTEPGESPRRGTYHGRDGVTPYLTQPRAAGAEVDSGRFIMLTPGFAPKVATMGRM
jgi:hypothetical protein